MSDFALIEETTRRLITDALTQDIIDAAERGAWPGVIWERLEAQGLLQPSAIAGASGSDDVLEIEVAVLKAVAATALPLPVAETALAGWFLFRHGIQAPSGPLTVASFAAGEQLSYKDGRVSGQLERVPWGRKAVGVVAIAGDALLLLDPRSAEPTPGTNMAGEPRDTLRFNGIEPLAVGSTADRELMLCRCAAVRAVQLAAAAARVLEIAVEYATQRQQFGRPISAFQAIQHQLAAAASEVASARVASEQAYLAIHSRTGEVFSCAIAKARASDAAGAVARVAHQIHGAIGYTREYQLHRFTRRIQSWRNEFGSSAFWAQRLGEIVLSQKSRSLWSIVTSGI
jgi:acyl-CoA dehydrogenase